MPRRLTDLEAFGIDWVVLRFQSEAQADEAAAFVPALRPHDRTSLLAPADALESVRTRLEGMELAFDEAEG